MGKTSIEWTDETWNPVTGCTKVSPGCAHCYAERLFPRAYGKDRKFTDIQLHPERLSKPLHWRKPRLVFVNSMSDLFHEDVPVQFIDKVFTVMGLAPKHTFQVLTKRPDRMRTYCCDPATFGRVMALSAELIDRIDGVSQRIEHRDDGLPGFQLENVWLGVSVEDQRRADERIPVLLDTPAAMRFVSAEPLLGPISFDSSNQSYPRRSNFLSGVEGERIYDGKKCALDWVIVGGESGPGARPMDPEWARFIREQCHASRIPFFMKQMAKKKPIPEDLMIREWPDEVRSA